VTIFNPKRKRATAVSLPFVTQQKWEPIDRATRQTRIRTDMPNLKSVVPNNKYSEGNPRCVKSGEEPNLVVSLAVGETEKDNNAIHFPCIDLDFGAKLVPSQSVGHYHLYLNRPITWKVYKDLLRALADAGIIETGYMEASIDHGYTALRPPLSHVKEMILHNMKTNKEHKPLSELIGLETGITGSDLIGEHFVYNKEISDSQDNYR